MIQVTTFVRTKFANMEVESLVDWETVMQKALRMKHKERRKYIKKIKRSSKRRALAASMHSSDGDSDDESQGNSTPKCPDNSEANKFVGPKNRDSAVILSLSTEDINDSVTKFNSTTVANESTEVILKSTLAEVSKDCNTGFDDQVKSDDHAENDNEEVKDIEISKLLENIAQEVREWHNPFLPMSEEDLFCKDQSSNEKITEVSTSNLIDAREKCSFFTKIGCCRFGDRCSRLHKKITSSDTLLLHGMFMTFSFDIVNRTHNSLHGDVDDLSLEHSDNDLYEEFTEFSNDVLPELDSFGKVVQFKVCCNRDLHLVGNVYVQYSSEGEASNAAQNLNGRYYGGRLINCEFVSIKSWKGAICGHHYNKNRCPRGQYCNYLHVFKDRSGRFFNADRDIYEKDSKYKLYHNSRLRGSNSKHRRQSRDKIKSLHRTSLLNKDDTMSDYDSNTKSRKPNKKEKKMKWTEREKVSKEKHKHKKHKHKKTKHKYKD